jgi:hypothetical protein
LADGTGMRATFIVAVLLERDEVDVFSDPHLRSVREVDRLALLLRVPWGTLLSTRKP